MPKPTKLHKKGKPVSLQKHNPAEKQTKTEDNVDPDDSIRQFQLELCWCVQQLERSLIEKKGNEKQLQDAWKVLTVLKSNNQPVIRKRQLMRTHFGDYRAKMAAEEKKLVKLASKIKIVDTPEKPKATFLRKSAFLSTGNDSFRFNFTTEEIDNETISAVPESATNIPHSKEISAKESNLIKINNEPLKFAFSDSNFKFNFSVDHS